MASIENGFQPRTATVHVSKRYKWLNASLDIVAAVLWHSFLVCFVDMLHNKAWCVGHYAKGACLHSSVSRTN